MVLRPVIYALLLYILISPAVLIADGDNDEEAKPIILPSLQWDSPEIYNPENGWFKENDYNEAVNRFADMVLKGHIESPNPRSDKIYFNHFGYSVSIPFKSDTPADVQEDFYAKFPLNPLIEEGRVVGGYQIGSVPLPPETLMENFLLTPETISLKNSWYGSTLSLVEWGDAAPANMISKVKTKEWGLAAWAAVYAIFIGGYELEDIAYGLNYFHQKLDDGTIIINYGLSKNSKDDPTVYKGTVLQNRGIYVFKPVAIKRGVEQYSGTMVYMLWYFGGLPYGAVIEKGSEYVERYLFPRDGVYKESAFTQEVRSMQEWSLERLKLLDDKNSLDRSGGAAARPYGDGR